MAPCPMRKRLVVDTWECSGCGVQAVVQTEVASHMLDPLPAEPPTGWMLIEAGDAPLETWEERERRAFCPDHGPKVTVGK